MEMRTVSISGARDVGEQFNTADVVKTAMQYKSKIQLTLGEISMNAKSFMGMTVLATAQGESVTVCAEGEDEKAAVESVSTAIQSSLHHNLAMA